MTRNKTFLRAFAILGCLLTAGTAFAGYRSWQYVRIGSNYFRGTLSGVRNSNDTREYIGCQVTGRSSGASVYCYARDYEYNYASCSSSEPALVSAVSGMNLGTRVYVSFTGSRCNYIIQDNSSRWLPKTESHPTFVN